MSIKVYEDRSKAAQWYFQMSTYLDMILKVFKMDQSKKEFLPEFVRYEVKS